MENQPVLSQTEGPRPEPIRSETHGRRPAEESTTVPLVGPVQTQTPPQPAQPPQAPPAGAPQQPLKSKLKIIFVVLFAVIVILSLLALFLWQRAQKQQEAESFGPPPSPNQFPATGQE